MKIRCEYESCGTAEKFYEEKGKDYRFWNFLLSISSFFFFSKRNPQELDVRKMLRKNLKKEEITNVMDLACGSGEVVRNE